MAATIYQVAQAAGVSPSTVSNVLNGRDGRMLPQTRKRVQQAMETLGYRPNRAARQLRTGRTGVIGLIVPSVANPFWGAFARHLEAAALEQGHHVLLCNSERDPQRERDYVTELWADGLRGIVLCTSLPSLEHLSDKIADGLVLVAVDRTAQVGDPSPVVNVSIDNVVGTQLATKHLLDLGHRRIAFISGSRHSVNRAERHRGFLAAVEQADTRAEPLTWDGGDGYADLDAAELGRTATAELLTLPSDRRPTAVVAINDMTALGACAGVRDADLVPGTDVSVIGFDDIVLAALAWPALTTVRQPLEQMARAAFDRIRLGLEDPEACGTSMLMRPELVVRDSTGPVPS